MFSDLIFYLRDKNCRNNNNSSQKKTEHLIYIHSWIIKILISDGNSNGKNRRNDNDVIANNNNINK